MLAAVCAAQDVSFSDSFETYAIGINIGGINGWLDYYKAADQGFAVSAANSSLSSGGQAMHMVDNDPSGSLPDARLQNVLTKSVSSANIGFDFMATVGTLTPFVAVRSGTAVLVASEPVVFYPFCRMQAARGLRITIMGWPG